MKSRFTLRQLEYLIACIDHASLAKAAEALNVSQPTISSAMNKLEEALGVQLLMRVPTKGVITTAHAQEILQSARLLLADADSLAYEANKIHQEVTGELRLGCFNTFAPLILPELLERFGKEHPKVTFRLFEGNQTELSERLLDNRLDLALMYDLELDASLHHLRLVSRKPHVLLPEGHPLTKAESLSLKTLVDLPMILLDVPPSRAYFLRCFDDHDLTPRIAYTSPSLELVRSMVGHGLGYALLVTQPYSNMTYDGKPLVIIPIKEDTPTNTIALVRAKRMRETRLIAAFQKAVKEIPYHA